MPLLKQFIVAVFFPLACLLLSFFLIFVIVKLRQRAIQQSGRFTPLTRDLLRPPGHSLRLKLSELELDWSGYLAMLLILPFAMVAMYFVNAPADGPAAWWHDVSYGLLTLLAATFLGHNSYLVLSKVHRLQIGLDGEMFVGEELNQLMLTGCRVYHDLPCDHGNIDHVVVSPTGVYSINTKMRGKPEKGAGKANLEVDFTTEKLHFPNGVFPLPGDQVRGEARWLYHYLSSAVGWQVKVNPVLAYPGWYIQRTGQCDVRVINPFRAEGLFLKGQAVYSAEQIQQIAHQLEQLCRNISPSCQRPANW
ncbi:nuclease-related domain-containing protein [Adhaeretor mobilis]|uniref:NERD domain-containing protein n=1 Tax=Adhaeretor mobilis TaxID=1930276 RepID=A0A517MTH0_9BACT|nr:nuclease-related domain-containing protein [Adhaeretor mobilis]QDS98152.1 hypothetical protein HG15A2_14250 [Adhaeretor mobilis]